MTKQDLQVLYRQETGNDIPTSITDRNRKEVMEYLKWLEDKLISIYNL